MSRKYNLVLEGDKNRSPKLSLNNIKVTALKIDHRNKFKNIYDQGVLGSCTANALCYAFIFNDMLFNPSRLFLYYNERALDNNINFDAGSTLRQGINALKQYGVCDEKKWPYIINKFKIRPPTNAFQDGMLHQVINGSS